MGHCFSKVFVFSKFFFFFTFLNLGKTDMELEKGGYIFDWAPREEQKMLRLALLQFGYYRVTAMVTTLPCSYPIYHLQIIW